jgi:hypothetical protein
MTTASFLSHGACKQAIELAEKHAFRAGGWRGDDEAYVQSTTDLEVDHMPEFRAWLHKIDFMKALQNYYLMVYGKPIYALDDLFVVKYTSEGQSSLIRHTDAGNVSFMVALSMFGDYDGGGTYFDDINDTVHLEQGQILVFDAELFHKGNPITRGTRYLLVGFCFTDKSRRNAPGLLGLDLKQTIGRKFDPFLCMWANALSFSTTPLQDVLAEIKELAQRMEDTGKTFWVANGLCPPQTLLERLALSIFTFHTQGIPSAAAADSGAEFWCQCTRRSESLPLHFDKDEQLLRESDILVTPYISTVTYLTSLGAPTLVLDMVADEDEDEDEDKSSEKNTAQHGFLCHPEMGKHFAFDGRFLHGVPTAATAPGCSMSRGGVRITFLVNVWLQHRPADSVPWHPPFAGGRRASRLADEGSAGPVMNDKLFVPRQQHEQREAFAASAAALDVDAAAVPSAGGQAPISSGQTTGHDANKRLKCRR